MITALVLAGGMTVTVLYFPTWAVAWVIGLFCLGGVWEWAGLTRLHGAARWVYLSAFALLMLGLARWGLDRGWTANTIMAVAVCWWGLAALALRIRPQRIPLYLVGATGPLALLPAWFSADPPARERRAGTQPHAQHHADRMGGGRGRPLRRRKLGEGQARAPGEPGQDLGGA